MMNGFGLMLDTNDRKEALRQVRKWVDKELGEPTTSIKVEGNKTIVTLPDGRVGVSRCNPCDKFDIITGIRVALDDIEKKSKKLTEFERRIITVAQDIGAETVYVMHYGKGAKNTVAFDNAIKDTLISIEHESAFDWVEDREYVSIGKILKDRV